MDQPSSLHLRIEFRIKLPPRPKRSSKPLVVPAYFLTAIKSNKKALATFNAFSPSNKREYVTWVTDATREKRLKTALKWRTEGKIRKLEIVEEVAFRKVFSWS